jgi:hypothetical protein
MNANELADALDTIGDKYLVILGDIEFKKAATMLRQQQEKLTKYELRHAEQRKRIDELEAELKLIDELVRGKAQNEQ